MISLSDLDLEERSSIYRLKIPYRTAHINANQVVIWAGLWSGPGFVLRDKKEQNLISDLLSTLDGLRTIEEVVLAQNKEVQSKALQFLILLIQRSILEKIPTKPANMDISHAEFEQFGNSFRSLSVLTSQSTESVSGRLRNSNVLFIGADSLAMRAALQLGNSGIASLSILDYHEINKSDLSSSILFEKSMMGKNRADVLAQVLNEHHLGTKAVSSSRTEWFSHKDIEQAMKNCTLAIVASNSPDLLLLQRVNDVALKLKKPWLAASLDGLEGVVGPAFFPYESCCFTCYQMRLESNMNNFADYVQYRSASERQPLASRNTNTLSLAGTIDILAGHVSLEVLRWLSIGTSRLAGRILRQDFRSGEIETNDVLKLPRCPSCSLVAEERPNEQIYHTYEHLIKGLNI
ncbi:MAG: TOMM precursor leader peptide-binding protein [Calditrichia bacterium]